MVRPTSGEYQSRPAGSHAVPRVVLGQRQLGEEGAARTLKNSEGPRLGRAHHLTLTQMGVATAKAQDTPHPPTRRVFFAPRHVSVIESSRISDPLIGTRDCNPTEELRSVAQAAKGGPQHHSTLEW